MASKAPQPAPELLTIPAAAARLGVSESWMRQQVNEGHIKGIALGNGEGRSRVWRVPAVTIDRLVLAAKS